MKQFRTHIISTEQQGLTVEQFIRQILQYSGRALQRMTRTKSIRLNGKNAYLQAKLKSNDRLQIAEIVEVSYGVNPEPGEVDVLYEDSNIIVLNKPIHLLVHPAGQTEQGTLANRLAYYFQQRGVMHKIRPLHRLDRDTTGCIIFAKEAKTQHQLELQMQNGSLKRTYLAIVEGCPSNSKGTIDAPIGKHPTHPNRRAVNEHGEAAITHYEVVDTHGDISLLRISLETGRTHQIRVHLAHIGHPVIGDKMYGKRSAWITRQALHASSVTWINQQLQPVMVNAPLPADMERLWRK